MSQSSNEDSYSQRFPDRRFYEGDNNWSSCDEVEGLTSTLMSQK